MKRPRAVTRAALTLLALAAPACDDTSPGPSAQAGTTGAPATAGVTGTMGSPVTAGTTAGSGVAGTMSVAGTVPPAGGTGAPPAGGTSSQAGTSGDSAGTSGSDAGLPVATADAGGMQDDAGPTGGDEPITCPSQALGAGDTTKMIQVGSTMRSYILHVPRAYDGQKPVPLVVDFHPLGGSGSQERSSSPYPAQTDPEGVIMAFPSGLRGPSGGAWNVGPCCVADVDDVAFAKALVADIQKTACIDPKRIYAVGFSMGGGMSHYLACHAADVFAAVAPAAFDLAEENVGDCRPPRPISVISFRGSSDPIVPYSGGYSAVVSGMPITFLGAQGTFEKWGEINQCQGSPSDAGNNCQAFTNCKDGVEVMLCTKQGGSHEPGNASVGWPALKRHSLP